MEDDGAVMRLIYPEFFQLAIDQVTVSLNHIHNNYTIDMVLGSLASQTPSMF